MNETLTKTDIQTSIRNAFPFEVERFPLYGPDGTSMPTKHCGLFRSDNAECVGHAVTAQYHPHTTDDVCALVEAASAAFNGTAKIETHWNSGHFVKVSPDNDWKRSVYDDRYPGSGRHAIRRDSDILFPVLLIEASYNGRAFIVKLGYERLICRNTASIPVKGQSITRSIRHSAALRGRMDDLIQDMSSVVSSTDNMMDAIDNAQRTRVNFADFLREVYPMADDATANIRNRHDRRIEKIVRRLQIERSNLGQPNGDLRNATAWEAYNAVQGYVQHDASRKKNPTASDRMMLSLADNAVARAAELAFA